MTATSRSVRRLLLTGCAAVLVAGCGGAAESRSGAVSGAPDSSGPQEAAVSAPSGPNAAQLAEPCPVHPDDVLAGQSAEARVRPGATRARVCLHAVALAPSPAPGAAGPVPVARTLAGGQAADLAARYAGLAPLRPGGLCTADLGPTVTVLFGYADESAVAVATELFGCGASRVAPFSRIPLGDPSQSGLEQLLLDTAAGRTEATTLP